MKKTSMMLAVLTMVFFLQIIPGKAMAAETIAAKEQLEKEFENPDGMTIDVLYVLQDISGEEVVKKVSRVMVPAGVTSVTEEIQEKYLPEGYVLKDAKDIPLTEETLEVRIPVSRIETKPTEPAEKPETPTEQPTEPAEKPETPTEKPTEPAEKPETPTEKPTQKPVKPAEKPVKPTEKPAVKPDPTNPQTGDALPIWLAASLISGTVLSAAVFRKYLPSGKK